MKYPNLSFKLRCGRRVFVHGLIWEPSYSEIVEVQDGDGIKCVEIERKRVVREALVGDRATHMIPPKQVNPSFSAEPRIQNTAITVVLGSTPKSDGALYSELIVTFFLDHMENASLEAMLERELRELDWNKLSTDVTESTNELWKEVWVEKTVH